MGLLAAAVRDPDPVLFFEHKSLYPLRGDVENGEIVEELGRALVRREGVGVSIVALAAMVPRAIEAAEELDAEGISAEVIDLRTLVPLDVSTVAESVSKTAHLVTVEENPRLCGWGAELSSIVAEELIYKLDGPIVRVTSPHVPLPAADALEDAVLPSVARIVEGVKRSLG
jgi:pyruvate dehydrogenase E1 component beta subunit